MAPCPPQSLRRRFEQNQEDCTFTVLALLPTVTTSILETMNTEKITYEIQQTKTPSKGAKGLSAAESAASPPSIADTTLTSEEDGKSMTSLQSESGVHASRVAAGEGGHQDGGSQQTRKTKRQLWDDLTISGERPCPRPNPNLGGARRHNAVSASPLPC